MCEVTTYRGAWCEPKANILEVLQVKITKTMRYEIAYDKDLYNLLHDIQYAIWRIKNKATQLAWDWQQFSFGYNDRFGEYPKEKDILGKGLPADINGQIKGLAVFVGSSIVDTAINESVKKFKNDKPKILRGEISIPSYRRDGSFPIRAQSIKSLVRINAKTYACKLSLLSKEGAKERGTDTQVDVTLRTGSGANVILDRIISGEYKMCDSEIAKVKTKYYLMLAYSHEVDEVQRDKSKVMGVDLGVVNAAVIAFNDSPERHFIGGSEISEFRRRIERRRTELLRQGKYCGHGRRGHGRVTRLKPIEKLRRRVEDFRKTTNHKYSKFIVEQAVKHGCGVIQLEKLDGISANSTFLKRWPYYDLQQKIAYKAKEAGIEVRMIEPKYTSQRCSECGHIAEGNRKTQAEFHCQFCGFKTNADYNAARNIATPGIESMIKARIESQQAQLAAMD